METGAKNQNFGKCNFFVSNVFDKILTVLDVSFDAEHFFQVKFFEKMTSSPQKMGIIKNLEVFKGSLTILISYSKTEDR